jgi:hypothetical protein
MVARLTAEAAPRMIPSVYTRPTGAGETEAEASAR